jgi:hypothetical protein
MRKLLLILLFAAHACISLHANNGEIKSKIPYADRHIWELSGSGSFSTHFYQDNREYEIDLTPSVAYFVVHRLHIGIKNMLLYTIASSDITGKWHHFYDYVGILSAGYVFRIKQKLYLDCMGDYGITLSQSDNRKYYGLISALKYDLDRVLLVMNVTYRYIDYDIESLIKDYSILKVGLGISLYL